MRRELLVAVALAAGLTVVAVIGAALQWWWLVVAAVMVLLSATFLAAVDADRRVRALRPFVKQAVHQAAGETVQEQAPGLTATDVIGAVQVLQAQYTGRMDRMQASLEHAVAQLRAEGETGQSIAPDDQA
ncbi:hypothetical protein FNH13_01210 [Ornithinimicrobium ciconiae]|uniref:Uncharacterized protein n=1 Tax=Ornithinimicrobium ciconiae TaxID=2594265 RepID=A0A516G6F1_9MICO|nr:hypothetical protein [Ornithinimicrobium ciconiae]QDO87111.1 hypothetical protein FNH13_01210 [Ornithinimicrobium ciconiae]